LSDLPVGQSTSSSVTASRMPSAKKRRTSSTRRSPSRRPGRRSSRPRRQTSTPGQRRKSTPRTLIAGPSSSSPVRRTTPSPGRSRTPRTSSKSAIRRSPKSSRCPTEATLWSSTAAGVRWPTRRWPLSSGSSSCSSQAEGHRPKSARSAAERALRHHRERLKSIRRLVSARQEGVVAASSWRRRP
jgi:hypothetical protein